MYTIISSIVLLVVFLFLIGLVVKETLAKRARKRKGEPVEESTVQEDLLRGIAGDVPKEEMISDEGKSWVEKAYSGKTPQGKRGRYLAGNEKSRIKEMVKSDEDNAEA
ncbi:hypothetical protein M2140_001767 [Clostridiales Family XIII bacterium PM5-7]